MHLTEDEIALFSAFVLLSAGKTQDTGGTCSSATLWKII